MNNRRGASVVVAARQLLIDGENK